MSVLLRPLRSGEYPDWRRRCARRYAEDMIRNGGFSEEDAVVKAERDFTRFLPDGLESEGHYLWAIEGPGGEVVGHLWLGDREAPDEGHRGFVFEIEIDEACRGRGYGRAAMLLLEDEVRALGLDRIELNVFGGNEVARGLYRSLGYEERAVMMGKKLG